MEQGSSTANVQPQRPVVHQHHFHLPPVISKLSLVMLLILGIAIGIGCTLFYQSIKAPKEYITMKGKGTVYLTPTQATLKVDVTASDVNQNIATTNNSVTVTQITQAIVALGIPNTAISVFHSVTPPSMPYPQVNQQTIANVQINQYQVTDTLTILFDTKTLGLTDKVVALMQNFPTATVDTSDTNSPSQNGVKYTFKVKNFNALLEQARIAAIEDAKNQALKVLSLNNRTLGKFISVKDTTDPATLPVISQDTTATLPDTAVLGNDLSIPVTLVYDVTYEEN